MASDAEGGRGFGDAPAATPAKRVIVGRCAIARHIGRIGAGEERNASAVALPAAWPPPARASLPFSGSGHSTLVSAPLHGVPLRQEGIPGLAIGNRGRPCPKR